MDIEAIIRAEAEEHARRLVEAGWTGGAGSYDVGGWPGVIDALEERLGRATSPLERQTFERVVKAALEAPRRARLAERQRPRRATVLTATAAGGTTPEVTLYITGERRALYATIVRRELVDDGLDVVEETVRVVEDDAREQVTRSA